MWLLAVIASAKDGVTGDVVCTARNACWPYHADAWRHADNPCDKEAVFDGRGGRIRVFYDDEVQPVTGIVDQVFGSAKKMPGTRLSLGLVIGCIKAEFSNSGFIFKSIVKFYNI